MYVERTRQAPVIDRELQRRIRLFYVRHYVLVSDTLFMWPSFTWLCYLLSNWCTFLVTLICI